MRRRRSQRRQAGGHRLHRHGDGEPEVVRKHRKEMKPARAGKAESPTRALAEFLQPYDPPVRALALGLRKLVISEVAPCRETLFRTSYTVAFLYSTSTRVSESFCHISVHRQHVNL